MSPPGFVEKIGRDIVDLLMKDTHSAQPANGVTRELRLPGQMKRILSSLSDAKTQG